MSTPIIIAFLGALSSAVAAIWSSISQAEESERNSTLNKKLAEKSDEIAKKSDQYAEKIDEYAKRQIENADEIQRLQKELLTKADIQNKKTEKIAELNAELAGTQKELAKLSIETTNNVTGGDGYCYVYLSPVSDTKMQVLLISEGPYPLSEVRVSIKRKSVFDRLVAEDEITKISTEELINRFIGQEAYFSMNSLPPDPTVAHPVGTVPFVAGVNEQYIIDFSARNGFWIQIYDVRYNKKGELKHSYVVSKTSTINGVRKRSIVVKEHTDPEFPK